MDILTLALAKKYTDEKTSEVTELIPDQAAPDNQLADKNFVNSSIDKKIRQQGRETWSFTLEDDTVVTKEIMVWYPDYLCFTANEAGSTVSMQAVSNAPTVSLEYSTDRNTWNTFAVGTTTVTLTNIGDKVYFRGTNTGFATNGASNRFVMTGSISASGNIMTILDSVGELSSIPSDYCFAYLFSNCQELTTAPELPATTLAEYCYYEMFGDCGSLVTAPELPATTLAKYCYEYMFYYCDSLITAPELPATTLAYGCYEGMFYYCDSLITAPELPATTLADDCYEYMFGSCDSLTTAPELPATTLAYGCYAGMFYECESLVTAPELPATTLAESCYEGMFYYCESLTTAPELPATTLADYCYYEMFYYCESLVTAPELPATTLADYCYEYMFYECTSLENITVHFSEWLDGATDDWLSGVKSSGTFYCPSSLEDIRDDSHIPTGWTKVDI